MIGKTERNKIKKQNKEIKKERYIHTNKTEKSDYVALDCKLFVMDGMLYAYCLLLSNDESVLRTCT